MLARDDCREFVAVFVEQLLEREQDARAVEWWRFAPGGEGGFRCLYGAVDVGRGCECDAGCDLADDGVVDGEGSRGGRVRIGLAANDTVDQAYRGVVGAGFGIAALCLLSYRAVVEGGGIEPPTAGL